ncbi:septum formation inhibitor Maf [Chryseobacterium sp. Leaf180]|uniref:Maf family protein n=1 Tax=Chryseobacterium sp. Leaf180 TaxID=1736289 RepID=UPI0006FE76D9|nr:Maf family nucleotide pyrophosphatase [Chryseobacterium sp. Leaf180]KQR95248.1 septum formation inhibitor Maf [Chryseobacterium sp. Leaf180]
MKKILLASQSPRRKELLAALGFDFEVVKIDCEEILPENILPENAAAYLARLKADTFSEINADQILITADTVVAFGNEILGKPKNAEEAKEMLEKLSGKTHQVYTAITVKTQDKTITETDVADVEMGILSDDEISFYIKKYKPFDKAGSYGVQEWIGMAKVEKIAGSYYTIMGLPTHLLYKILKNL